LPPWLTLTPLLRFDAMPLSFTHHIFAFAMLRHVSADYFFQPPAASIRDAASR
jgi:hypothetical protein